MVFRALSNPQRLRIFLRLAACCGPGVCCGADIAEARRCVGELGRDLGIAASTVSHHIKELRNAGLMHVERSGQRIECWICADAVRFLSDFIATLADGEGGCHVSG
jgi:ArsR family transcriptional regulator